AGRKRPVLVQRKGISLIPNVYSYLFSIQAPGGPLEDTVLRAGLAALTAFLASLLLGAKVIKKLVEYQVKEDTLKTHSKTLRNLHADKRNTPTMGGIIILLALFISVALWCNVRDYSIGLLFLTAVGLGVLGFADDYLKLTVKDSFGLRDKTKLAFQLVLGLVVGIAIYQHFKGSGVGTGITLPFLEEDIELGYLYVVLAMFYVAWSSNAVNLTDGLDGLAIGCTILAGLILSFVAYALGDREASLFFGVDHMPGAKELSIFCAALVGSGLGFLWYNGFPAQAFMGDVGSLSVGGVLAVVALLLKQEFLFVLIGMVFMLEAFSVFLQVAVFKLSGRRVFYCAPLHHHLQFMGWPETRITVRLWIVAVVMGLLGLLIFRIG
ncbi:MAG: phospho-N-acetylmuramoyl-pentapeptide-transferase, partial [Candidatus Brocadiales bacterium]